jgi:hypothetical protein
MVRRNHDKKELSAQPDARAKVIAHPVDTADRAPSPPVSRQSRIKRISEHLLMLLPRWW